MAGTIILIVYGLALLGIAFAGLKYADTIDNFLIAGRSQNKILVTASMLASTIGGGITIGTVAKTYAIGFPAFWFVAAGAIAHFLQGALLSEKVRATEAVTMPDLAAKLVGPSLRMVTSLIILVTWLGIATAQFAAASKIIEGMTGISHYYAVIAAALFLIAYTLIGGQKSVLRTDLFQFGFLALALIFSLGWLFLSKPVSQLPIEIFNRQFGFLDLLYYLVVLGGSYFICPMMFSRILSADSPRSAKKSSFMSGVGMIIFAFTVTFIGLWAKASVSNLDGMDPLNFIAKHTLPSALGMLLVLGLLAAILSTGDTVLLTAAGILQHDLLQRTSVAGVRIGVIGIGAAAAFIALYETDIIAILIKTYNGYTAGIVPVFFAAILTAGKKKMHAGLAVCGVILGYACGLAGSFAAESSMWSKLFPIAGLALSALFAALALAIKKTA